MIVNSRSPIIESDSHNRIKELSKSKTPVKIKSVKTADVKRENSSKVKSRLKVKGNIEEFKNKQALSQYLNNS